MSQRQDFTGVHGLGLSICSKLAHLMGGDIGVISTFGSGTNFWFSIPFAVEKAKTDADAEPTAENRPANGQSKKYRK